MTDTEARLIAILSKYVPDLEERIKKMNLTEDYVEIALTIDAADYLKLTDDDFDNPTISLSALLSLETDLRIETIVDFLQRWPDMFQVGILINNDAQGECIAYTTKVRSIPNLDAPKELLFDFFNCFRRTYGMSMNPAILLAQF